MSKYLFTPIDIALFFKYGDFNLLDERYIINDIWNDRNFIIEAKYRSNKYKFTREIYTYLEMLEDGYEDEIDSINRTLIEIGSSCKLSKYENKNCIESYLKFMKLKLSYLEGCDDIRLKFKTLLKKIGYKKRTKKIVSDIIIIMNKLELESNLRGRKKCDLSNISLDDILIIRLKY